MVAAVSDIIDSEGPFCHLIGAVRKGCRDCLCNFDRSSGEGGVVRDWWETAEGEVAAGPGRNIVGESFDGKTEICVDQALFVHIGE